MPVGHLGSCSRFPVATAVFFQSGPCGGTARPDEAIDELAPVPPRPQGATGRNARDGPGSAG